MKKAILLAAAVSLLLVTVLPVLAAPKDDHKVRNKWNLSGTLVAHPGYNWGGLAEGATWTYRIRIKEAMNGEYSVGSIHFMTGDVDVVGHVKATSRDVSWGDLAAVGMSDYNETSYYFMFLIVDYAMWFALSTTPYDTFWEAESIWPPSLRAYQLHSLNPGSTFTLDYKAIHGDSQAALHAEIDQLLRQ